MNLAQRIEALSIPEPNTGCWLWLNCDNGAGYGITSIDGRQAYAHRASYLAFKGEIPTGLVVRHKCDVRACVNPDHLVLGTHAENMADVSARGRAGHKLTQDQARAVFVDGRPKSLIAREYGVSRGVVQSIKRRRTYVQATAGL